MSLPVDTDTDTDAASAPGPPKRSGQPAHPDGDPARTDADAVAPTPGPERELPETSRRREAAVGRAVAALATFSLRLLLIAAATLLLGYVVSELWVILLPVLLLLAALVAVLAPQVTGQAEEIANQVVGGLENVQGFIQGPPLNLGEDAIGGAVDSVIGELQANAQSIAGRVLSGAAAAGSLLLTGLLAVVLCFFYLKDGPKFLPWLGGLVGPRAAPHVSALGQRAWVTLSGFIKAQAAVGLVDAVAIGIGLLVLGVPLAVPLAVLIFFGAFIPIIGAVVTGALAALIALVTNGVTSALIVIGLVLLVQQLEGNVLQPILVGRTLDLHPAVVILAVTAGGTIAGITGAFLAVPVVSVLAVAVRYARQHLAEVEPGPGSPPAAAGQPAPQNGVEPPEDRREPADDGAGRSTA